MALIFSSAPKLPFLHTACPILVGSHQLVLPREVHCQAKTVWTSSCPETSIHYYNVQTHVPYSSLLWTLEKK